MLIGQTNLPVLNRSGIYMYWNNCWLNNFNQNHFFNKVMFVESIFFFIFSERVIKYFFSKKYKDKKSKNFFYKSIFRKKILKKNLFKKKDRFFFKRFLKKRKKKKIFRKKYNFSRLWFVKFNNYILLTVFCFFHMKIKKKKILKRKFKKSRRKSTFINKIARIFWKKKKGKNLKRRSFVLNNYLNF